MLVDEDTLILFALAQPLINPPYPWGVALIKADTLGNILSYNVVIDSLNRTYLPCHHAGILKLRNNQGYIFIGAKSVSIGFWVMRFDRSGKFVGETHYSDVSGITFYPTRVFEDDEGGLFIFGTQQESADFMNTIFLMRISASGEKLWHKRYRAPGMFESYSSFTVRTGIMSLRWGCQSSNSMIY